MSLVDRARLIGLLKQLQTATKLDLTCHSVNARKSMYALTRRFHDAKVMARTMHCITGSFSREVFCTVTCMVIHQQIQQQKHNAVSLDHWGAA